MGERLPPVGLLPGEVGFLVGRGFASGFLPGDGADFKRLGALLLAAGCGGRAGEGGLLPACDAGRAAGDGDRVDAG
ncbi:MAG: hypothetical protein P8Z40_01010 [Chloroflexota bacterium]